MQGALQKIGRRLFLRRGLTPRCALLLNSGMPELKIGLADVTAFNFDQSFLQFNAKKKINRRNLLDLNLNAEY